MLRFSVPRNPKERLLPAATDAAQKIYIGNKKTELRGEQKKRKPPLTRFLFCHLVEAGPAVAVLPRASSPLLMGVMVLLLARPLTSFIPLHGITTATTVISIVVVRAIRVVVGGSLAAALVATALTEEFFLMKDAATFANALVLVLFNISGPRDVTLTGDSGAGALQVQRHLPPREEVDLSLLVAVGLAVLYLT
uniref:Uncharacterized protein TCIL3000_8_620 n=1 Tax=Trypanosoma congolense (strain IL3000) TaxID=1068625 RepID=G0UR44_TRYCI|nr:unnamed protein product [Trypanosoma congolense IL3000]